MIHLPFSATVAGSLLVAMFAGGAIAIMTPPPDAPASGEPMQASAAPSPAAPATQEAVAEPQSKSVVVDQTISRSTDTQAPPPPPTQASAAPSPSPAAPATQEAAAEPRSKSVVVDQTITQLTDTQAAPPPQTQVVVEQSETKTTSVATPVAVASSGILPSRVGCVEHGNLPHPLAAAIRHPNHEHAGASPPRKEIPRLVHIVHRGPRIAVVAAHSG